MEQTSLYLLIFVNSMVIVSTEGQNSGDVMRVSLRLSPNRFQFFIFESVFLSCEDRQSNSTVWRLERTDITNFTSECGAYDWGKMNTTGCLVSPLLPLTGSGVYWCESSEGKSNTVNITVTDGAVILERPVLPVMEGSNVTLHCRTQKTSSDLPADFYKDGSFIRTESTGRMTIHHVYKSDEGFYKCHISDREESPESWMDVRVSPASKDNDQPDPPSVSLPPYFYPLMCAGGSIFLLILGVCLWKKCRGCRTDRQSKDVIYADVTVKQEDRHRTRRDQTSSGQDIYSMETINTDATTYSDINHTARRNPLT